MTRLQLVMGFDPYTASDLEPDYPPMNPILTEAVGSELKTRLLHTAGLLLNQYEQVRDWLGGAPGQGSNSWVVAPKHSLNRRALLCADPHLNVQLPAPLYEMHLSCPTLQASGATQPGLPGLAMGHNNLIAWGAVNALVDTQDLFIEQVHPDDPRLFLYDGNWEQATVIEEPITVRRGGTHVEQVVMTRHGALLNGLLASDFTGAGKSGPAATVPLSLQWSGLAPGNQLRARIALLRAQDWESFTAALQDWVTPAQSFTYADARGNIGGLLAGRMPLRGQHLGLVPAPGWDAAFAWAGTIPHTELPRVYNPPSGLIVAANQKLVGDDYPYFLGVEFDPGWRAARIEEMLLEKERHTIRDMQEIQQDNQSKFAQAFTPWLTLLRSEDPWEKTAIQLLRKWNWRMDSDSSGALCFHFVVGNLLEMGFGDKLGPARTGYFGVSVAPLATQHGLRLHAEARLLELINEHDESIWFTDAASGRRRMRDEVLQEALTRAMKSIRQVHGDSSLRWAWGRSHQIRFPHPLGRARLVGGFFDRGPLPIGGDGTTPNQTRSRTALPAGLVQVLPAYRQVYEVGAWDRAETVIAGGQSGHPLSRLYDDQIMMWREGVYHATPWSDEAIDKLTEYKLTLTPG
ncbi:MAG: penicillin acylase family protein [Anaerolineales bacterium]|nr:penicillin acylase family protein [Anaerolineales bacterium]